MLQLDAVLFAGDYGGENGRILQRISKWLATAATNVATVLGNHDACNKTHVWVRASAPASSGYVLTQQPHLRDMDASYGAGELSRADTGLLGGR